MSFYMDSDRGNVRQNNEDSFLFEQFEKLNILILADGVGGHEDGEIASGYAVNIVMEYIKSNYKLYSDYLHLLVDAFCEANKVIYEINLEKNSEENKISNRLMGTTLEVLLFDGDVLYFGHVGDSRIYVKDDNFRLLTKDHSLVQYLYSSGALTEEEVKKSLIDYNLEYEMGDVKDWYDGYRFGNSEVYNPWSILNFLQDKELRAYWVDTSGNDLINDVLKKITKDTVRALERLFNGEGLRQNISGTSDLSKLLDENELWELLLFSGYLTIEEKIDQKNYILRLPNKEVKELFKDSFLEKYFGRGNKLSDLMEALTENRIEDYEESLQEILLTSVSYNDTKKGNEAFYHGLIMGMGLYLEGEYITKSNIESGLGRYDFLIEPKNKSKRAFIMEFKSTDSVQKLEEVSKEALQQIEDKKYDISLKQNGIKEITYIGIAFCGKKIKISYK